MDAFNELKQIEQQIIGMKVMPDFEDGEDNCIIEKEESFVKKQPGPLAQKEQCHTLRQKKIKLCTWVKI